MSIIAALPFNLVNGSTADATQVMADFNRIVTDVNNNAVPDSGGTLTSTTITDSIIDNTPIGNTTRNTGKFTTLDANSTFNATGAATLGSTLDVTGKAMFDGGVKLTAGIFEFAPPTSVASAATVDLGAQTSNDISITGSVAITSFGATADAGTIFEITFVAPLTLTYNATSMILPTSADIITQAGDTARFEALGSSNFKCLSYNRANGAPVSGIGAIRGDYRNLQGSWISNTTAVWSADQVVLTNSLGLPQGLSPYSQTLNTALAGAGGLDTGALAASTWYNVFAIYGTTPGPSILMSLSTTAPTLPAGYTYFARLGTVVLDSSKNLIGFVQNGRNWQYSVGNNLTAIPTIASGISGNIVTPTYSAVAVRGTTSLCPPTAGSISFNVYQSNGFSIFAPNANYGKANPGVITGNVPYFQCIPAGGTAGSGFGTMNLENNSVYYASNGSVSAYFLCGFVDNL